MTRKEGSLLHYPGSGKPGPQIANTKWAPERMGQKFIPRVCIWDEVCTVPRPILETFVSWLEGQGIQVVCCGDQGQQPPIAGEMPHDWLRGHASYFEEVKVDRRAKDPLLQPSRSESICSQTRPSAERYERGSLIASGGNASWRPGSRAT